MKTVMERLRYRGPDIDTDGVVVDRFQIGGENESFGAFIANLHHSQYGRGMAPGTYARLLVDHQLWMSDTTAELQDHRMPVAIADQLFRGGTGLVTGLGLGCVVGAMLDSLEHVDVIEREQRVIDTVGAWYVETFGDRVTIHHGDAMTFKWPRKSYWSVVWHDIWPSICTDNLSEMAHLHRSYGGRSAWQGSWAQSQCRWMRRKEAQWER